jgi:hypothetical protein
MTKIKQTIIFLVAIAVASLTFNSSLSAQTQGGGIGMYCVPTYEILTMQTKEREQLLAFVGITRTGTYLWFFANSENFSVFFKDKRTGDYCTSPKYWGKIVDTAPMDDYLNDERP